jgi:transposase
MFSKLLILTQRYTSSAIRWVRCWREDGSSPPKPRSGSRSVLEDYAERILALVAEHRLWNPAK